MQANKKCEHIRHRIEDAFIAGTEGFNPEIESHILSCEVCRIYASEVRRLSEFKNVRYKVPEPGSVKFSANVRAEIERRKQIKRPFSVIPRPALQAIMMVIVTAAVLTLLFRSYDFPRNGIDTERIGYSYEELIGEFTVFGTGDVFGIEYVQDIPDEYYYANVIGTTPVYAEDLLLSNPYYIDGFEHLTDEQLEEVALGLERM
jgi:hypothetical protein